MGDSTESENLQVDDNLLETLREVSYDDRENDIDNAIKKEKKSDATNKCNVETDSLPDARAKVLHLQRVQRSGDSNSNDTNGSTSKPKRPDQDVGDDEQEEKEETVSFSLENIIRRGLNEQKINTNFKKEYPDFERSEEAAERFRSLLNKDPLRMNNDVDTTMYSESDYESEKDEYDNVADESIDNNTETEEPPAKKKRGRPKLTPEEKQLRGIVDNNTGVKKKRGRPRKVISDTALDIAPTPKFASGTTKKTQLSAVETPVDQLMAMGHSLFSECEPKKRGRKPKIDTFMQFYDDPLSSMNIDDSMLTEGDNDENDDTAEVTDAKEDIVGPGRNQIVFQNRELTVTELPTTSREPSSTGNSIRFHDKVEFIPTSANLTTFPSLQKKRGRKPKQMVTFDLPKQSLDDEPETKFKPQQYLPHILQNAHPPEKKKRGRKPKYLTSGFTKSANSDSAAVSFGSLNDTLNSSLVIDESVPLKKKRGRKPKSFHIQQKQEQYMNTTAPARIENTSQSNADGDPQIILSHETTNDENQDHNASADPMNYLDISHDPATPARKKRGRKPKGYYEQLAQQSLANHNNSAPDLLNQSARSSLLDDSSLVNAADVSSNSGHPDGSVIIPKKRGRKPKSYHLMLQQQQQHVKFDSSVGDHSTPIKTNTSTDTLADDDDSSFNASGILNHKRVSIPTSKHYDIKYIQKMKLEQKLHMLHNKSPMDISPLGVIKKKRGRKPKNYVPENDGEFFFCNFFVKN